jgi:hypothetical protein
MRAGISPLGIAVVSADGLLVYRAPESFRPSAQLISEWLAHDLADGPWFAFVSGAHGLSGLTIPSDSDAGILVMDGSGASRPNDRVIVVLPLKSGPT